MDKIVRTPRFIRLPRPVDLVGLRAPTMEEIAALRPTEEDWEAWIEANRRSSSGALEQKAKAEAEDYPRGERGGRC